MPLPEDTASADPLLVACLCAAWCRVCESYRAEFAELRRRHPETRFVWVDIEDDAELVDELEVETFPTLLIGQGERLRFIGPVAPQLAPAQRLIAAARESGPSPADPAAQALLHRLVHSC
ncbi:thioredoxin family protein [Pelomonas sp. CA6]|uniref:thioredoxin family protein n=1 Tax=Pelomonas sp. CA6 TaxID=2907999 RepID=UPI001F4C35F7|nr:thioredoxin family protein [Pelomonas sp. CA6]MCH7345425.1 thioredoxin family protein [Pelomonas sp. CA6]